MNNAEKSLFLDPDLQTLETNLIYNPKGTLKMPFRIRNTQPNTDAMGASVGASVAAQEYEISQYLLILYD